MVSSLPEIKLLVLDMDGTFVPTYKKLRCYPLIVKEFAAAFSLSEEAILHKLRPNARGEVWIGPGYLDFQDLLHDPVMIFDRLLQTLSKEQGCNAKTIETKLATVRQECQDIVKEACRAENGFFELLTTAYESGTKVAIYTNTGTTYTHRKLAAVSKQFEVWKATHGVSAPPLSSHFERVFTYDPELRSAADADALSDLFAPYATQKPSGEVIAQLQADLRIAPQHTLMIGDSRNDFQSVYQDSKKFRHRLAHFAWQKDGADLSPTEIEWNQKLRPAQRPNPLGLAVTDENGFISGRLGTEAEGGEVFHNWVLPTRAEAPEAFGLKALQAMRDKAFTFARENRRVTASAQPTPLGAGL